GTGYPRGLRGEEIPLAARLFAVVDVYDALTSDRPYRAAWPRARALEYIRDSAGSHFDPRIVDVFLEMLEEREAVRSTSPGRDVQRGSAAPAPRAAGTPRATEPTGRPSAQARTSGLRRSRFPSAHAAATASRPADTAAVTDTVPDSPARAAATPTSPQPTTSAYAASRRVRVAARPSAPAAATTATVTATA